VASAEEPTGSVRGTLTVVGHPFPRAKLFLHPKDGKAISCRVRDGAFAFEKVPVGAYRVSTLIDPDGRLVAVRIPAKELRREVAKAVGQSR
jgi:hypothetical protein